ncbi:MAG: aminoglycoside phosphotransferase family protein [Actinomycetota bacterium]|nr:aminoglycoside phosphotransferase family protein [Actinomycetota bacterium]
MRSRACRLASGRGPGAVCGSPGGGLWATVTGVSGVPGTRALGEPFASGREADVYALGDGKVLRRYRDGGDAAPEALVMWHVGRHGFPVPRVFAVEGPDLILERLQGPTMATMLLDGSMSIHDGAAILAELLGQLHALPSLAGDVRPVAHPDQHPPPSPATDVRTAVHLDPNPPPSPATDVRSVVHLDLHPENVVVTAGGPVVIDWRNARDGVADLDTAFTALILGQVATGAIAHPIQDRAGEMLDIFLELAPGDPLRALDEAVEMRSRQNTLSVGEIGMLPLAAARVRGVGK